MDKKSSEQEYLTNDDEQKTLIKQIYQIIRSNWIALGFALLITIITIVVVPIVYSLQKPNDSGNGTNLAWNVTGITIVNETVVSNGYKYPLGIISSIIFDSEDNLFILDKTQHRLLKYTFADKELTLIVGHENGTSGNGSDSLNSPNDIFNYSLTQFYIADTGNNRIQLWNTETGQGSTVCGTGTPGSDTNPLNQPMSLTMDGESNIYIADYKNNQIVVCNLTTNQLKVLIPYNINQERHTYVYTPIAIKYYSASNSLVIAQEMGYNVIRWILGSNSWTLIAGSASSELSGTSRTLFNQLCNVNIDDLGNTYVVDCYNQRIQFYQGDLTKGRTIAGVIQANGSSKYLFDHPTAVALDRTKNLYVADSNNYRIQKFVKV